MSAETTTVPAVDISGVAVAYGRRQVLSGIDLAVRAGEVCALLGRNGSGKSSLVRALLGQQPVAAGAVRLLGRDPWRERPVALASVGYVPEEPLAPPALDARRLSAFCSRLHARWDGAAVLARLARAGVPIDRPFGRLSKGQKKQVELALALGHAPALLVLDDPTLGLDPLSRKAFFGELMDELAGRGTSVLLTSHDLDAVEGIADAVAILGGGRLLVAEPLEELKGRFRRLVLRRDAAGVLASAPAGLVPLLRRARPWGEEVVVDRWDDSAAPPASEAQPLSLDEIFAALHGGEGEAA